MDVLYFCIKVFFVGVGFGLGFGLYGQITKRRMPTRIGQVLLLAITFPFTVLGFFWHFVARNFVIGRNIGSDMWEWTILGIRPEGLPEVQKPQQQHHQQENP